jgi:hypothetical protein
MPWEHGDEPPQIVAWQWKARHPAGVAAAVVRRSRFQARLVPVRTGAVGAGSVFIVERVGEGTALSVDRPDRATSGPETSASAFVVDGSRSSDDDSALDRHAAANRASASRPLT